MYHIHVQGDFFIIIHLLNKNTNFEFNKTFEIFFVLENCV